jgi:hypothetical protein
MSGGDIEGGGRRRRKVKWKGRHMSMTRRKLMEVICWMVVQCLSSGECAIVGKKEEHWEDGGWWLGRRESRDLCVKKIKGNLHW